MNSLADAKYVTGHDVREGGEVYMAGLLLEIPGNEQNQALFGTVVFRRYLPKR